MNKLVSLNVLGFASLSQWQISCGSSEGITSHVSFLHHSFKRTLTSYSFVEIVPALKNATKTFYSEVRAFTAGAESFCAHLAWLSIDGGNGEAVVSTVTHSVAFKK